MEAAWDPHSLVTLTIGPLAGDGDAGASDAGDAGAAGDAGDAVAAGDAGYTYDARDAGDACDEGGALIHVRGRECTLLNMT